MLAILTPDEDGGFVALNPETGTTTQGESIDEALANLREAVELFLEEFPMKIAGSPFVHDRRRIRACLDCLSFQDRI